jgi:hypothetical protein
MNDNKIILGFSILFILGGCAANTWQSISTEDHVVVAKTAYQTTFDTTKAANGFCKKYGKIAVLKERAKTLSFPYSDKFRCVKP